jgi:hypothetical protein
VTRGRRAGRFLLKCWVVAAAIYVVAAGVMSVAPIRIAIVRADHTRASPPSLVIGEVVARQAAITLAPPLLALWFGWDLWFAAVGFLRPTPATRDDDE